MQNKLAIIIPAFKSLFLKQTIESISEQSCKDFTLYIGDDASHEDIYGIIKQYESRINIVYHRFAENLGGKSLTGQWDRCVALSKDEPYIWLFSDDDEMSENAVSSFYDEIEKNADYNLHRFDLNIIDEKSDITKELSYPDLQDEKDFFKDRINESMYSCITQYIFTRLAYNSNSGFISFPLAWFSDDASVIKFAHGKGIKKVSGAKVKWRFADGINISSSKKFEKQKARAVFEYALWFNHNLNNHFSRDEINTLTRIFLSKRMLKMPVSECFRFSSIKTIFTLSGFVGGLYILFYDAYCRIKLAGHKS